MLIVLSPSKTLDYSTPVTLKEYSKPELLKESGYLIERLREYSPARLQKLMGISPKLAALNAERFKAFRTPFTPENARQALLAFKGDVYAPMRVERYAKADFAFAQKHLRILSGLYGALKPLDLIQPYRLEMGCRLATPRGKHLYAFWDDTITKNLNEALHASGGDVLVNLASEEYFQAVRPDALMGRILHVQFKERRGDALKIIGLMAKKARGTMADWIIRNRVTVPERLREFREDGYRFQPALSDTEHWVFARYSQ